MTGYDTATRLMRNRGVSGIAVNRVEGRLTDHYNPSKKVVNLSMSTYGSASVAAVAVAAHEVGHVMQKQTGYIPYKIRNVLVPLTNIGSRLALPVILVGLLLDIFWVSAPHPYGQWAVYIGIASTDSPRSSCWQRCPSSSTPPAAPKKCSSTRASSNPRNSPLQEKCSPPRLSHMSRLSCLPALLPALLPSSSPLSSAATDRAAPSPHCPRRLRRKASPFGTNLRPSKNAPRPGAFLYTIPCAVRLIVSAARQPVRGTSYDRMRTIRRSFGPRKGRPGRRQTPFAPYRLRLSRIRPQDFADSIRRWVHKTFPQAMCAKRACGTTSRRIYCRRRATACRNSSEESFFGVTPS